MTVVFIILGVVFAAGILLGLYAWLAPRQAATPPPPPVPPLQGTTDWTAQAGDEFAGLADSARCDLVFAVSDLDDERSQQLLLHALNDPSDAVALAAAHALARRGSVATVNEYVQRHPGERAEHIMQTLSLLE